MFRALIYTPGYITRFGLVALCPVQQALPLRTFTKHSASPYLVFDLFTTLTFMKRAGYLNGRSVFRGLEWLSQDRKHTLMYKTLPWVTTITKRQSPGIPCWRFMQIPIWAEPKDYSLHLSRRQRSEFLAVCDLIHGKSTGFSISDFVEWRLSMYGELWQRPKFCDFETCIRNLWTDKRTEGIASLVGFTRNFKG